MGTLLWRGLAGFVTASRYAVAAPILLVWLLIYLGIGFFVFGLAAILALGILGEFTGGQPAKWQELLVAIPVLLMGLTVTLWFWGEKSGVSLWFRRRSEHSHGSARLASKADRADLLASRTGLLIGRDPGTGGLLRYDGPAHLLTLAPTRSGKGVGTVMPNLLDVDRAMLVIDPKGENARIAAARRMEFGPVHILDPFGVTGFASACYNPLDRLTPDSLDLGEDAATLAEALVTDPPGQVRDAHWNEEARALIAGLILFCVSHEDPGRRNLATIREYLSLPADRLRQLLELMQDSDAAHGLIARAANRFLGKADREAASVLSNAQRHTHFLDSPRIAAALARSDFHFADLRYERASVFLVLPPNRMDAYARWLRLLVSQALQDIARNAEAAAAPVQASDSSCGGAGAPEASQEAQETSTPLPASLRAAERLDEPCLFLLDEFAALGRLEAVERGMGLMAGYGLQLWPILQDMSQLKDLYGTRANTFVANAGVVQTFGVNDYETAKWLSQSMGRETIGYETSSHRPGDMPSTSQNVTGRDLLTPDEIMQLPQHLQLLRLQGRPAILAEKLRYYDDPYFAGLFDPEADQ